MIVTVTAGQDQLAALARAEAAQFAPRTPPRRAAAALWASLVTTSSVDAARKALAGFAAPEVQAGALDLLHRLAADLAVTTNTEGTQP